MANVFKTVLMVSLTFLLGTGCRQPGAAPGKNKPSDEDLRVIKQNILSQTPNMKFKVNADLEGKIEYLGLDLDRDLVKPGESFTLTHYWKVTSPVEGWEIFVHCNDTRGKNAARLRVEPVEIIAIRLMAVRGCT